MSYIKAIVINPILKTVVAVDMPNDFNTMKRDYLKCDTAEVIDLGSNVDAWIDEEGTLKDWDEQGFTNLAGAIQLAGIIVLCGRDRNNDMADLPEDIDLEFVRGMAIWIPATQVKLRGTTVTFMGADGKPETVACGPEVRTYENQQ